MLDFKSPTIVAGQSVSPWCITSSRHDTACCNITGNNFHMKTAMPKSTALVAGEQRHVSTCRVIEQGSLKTNDIAVARCRRYNASQPMLKGVACLRLGSTHMISGAFGMPSQSCEAQLFALRAESAASRAAGLSHGSGTFSRVRNCLSDNQALS